jgi:hypothetical protein
MKSLSPNAQEFVPHSLSVTNQNMLISNIMQSPMPTLNQNSPILIMNNNESIAQIQNVDIFSNYFSISFELFLIFKLCKPMLQQNCMPPASVALPHHLSYNNSSNYLMHPAEMNNLSNINSSFQQMYNVQVDSMSFYIFK